MTSLLPVLLIVGAIALVVGPIFLLQPTGRQRREIALRNKALKLGMRVHMMPLPVGPERKVQQMPVYVLPWKKDGADIGAWLLVRGNYEHELNFDGLWQWEKNMAADPTWHSRIREILPKLPEGVKALANGPQGVSLYWNELGGEDEVEVLLALLQQMRGSS